MNNNNNNANDNKNPPPSKQNDDNNNSDHNEDSSESANSTKPGAVAMKEEDQSKIKQKREVQMKYNAPFYRAISIRKSLPVCKNIKMNENDKKYPPPSRPSSTQNNDKDKSDHDRNASESKNSTKPGAVVVGDGDASKIKKKRETQMKYNTPCDRAFVLLGHYPINEEPGSNFMNEVGYLEKIERSISKCTVSVTSQDVVAVKDTKNSNVKGKKKLRPQLYKHMAVIESTTSKNDNENIENRVNFE